jgi:hypothetical protein
MRRQNVCDISDEYLMKVFLTKDLSDRKIKHDKVIELEQDEQSSASLKTILEAATIPMVAVPINVVVLEIKVSIKPSWSYRIRNQITRFKDENVC